MIPKKPQISTGQQFPEGIDYVDGRECAFCDRTGQVALIALELPNMPRLQRIACAECIADFVVAPIVKVFAQRDGVWHRLAAEIVE